MTSRNTSVSATSKIVSAISFGVRWRRADSTIRIIRSRKVSPGLAVTRTISQSDSTRVPPVTERKSPPLSRMTGALSPVIALSSTEATPSMTSPSAGMKSPASTSTTMPAASWLEGVRKTCASLRGSYSFLATICRRCPRNAAA